MFVLFSVHVNNDAAALQGHLWAVQCRPQPPAGRRPAMACCGRRLVKCTLPCVVPAPLREPRFQYRKHVCTKWLAAPLSDSREILVSKVTKSTNCVELSGIGPSHGGKNDAVARKMHPPRGRFARNLVKQVVLETFCSVSLYAYECIATRWCPLHPAEHPPHPSAARTLGDPLLGDAPLRGISCVLRARPSRTDEIKTSSTLPPMGLTQVAVLPEL